MDAISRVLSLGGAGSLDIFHVILLTSYHLSLTLLEETGCKVCSSLHVGINLDADYEAVIGNIGKEFQKFTLHHLRALFSKNQLDVHALLVQKGSIQISFLLQHAVANEDLYLEDRFQHTFQVPNHLKIIMKKKLFHLRIDPILENHPRRLFHVLDFLRNQINVKYPSLSYYINRHLLNELQTFSSRKMAETHPDYRKISILTYDKPNPEADFGSSTKTQTSYEHSPSGKLNFKNLEKEYPGGTLSRHLSSLNGISLDSNHKSRTRRSSEMSSDDSNVRSRVRFSFQNPAANANNEEFLKHLKKQLAKRIRVPLSSIKDLEIKSGKDVSFILIPFNDDNNVMDDKTAREAAEFLRMEIKNERLSITDLNGKPILTGKNVYISNDDEPVDFSLVVLILLCITLFMIIVLIFGLVYIGRRVTKISSESLDSRQRTYRNMEFGRDSSQSVGKYSYDSGLWLGPGSEPTFTVPDAPYYRPPTVEQIASTPRPITAVRTRLKTNWNVDERALSAIPDDLAMSYIPRESRYQ
ncbi:uncharacterized protein LOC129959474 [Argiope bruennichi]|uniref:uncharacterized protein LOC129959474 n=1 Tax=Argiope bruennichi TaxID=94029 RepID=UPI002493DA87|nr:uncharacterized protein LOC129959474 [Argiope bruennichi]